MQQSKTLTDDNGSASLEFITTGMLLLVPIVYLVIAVAAIQGAAFAVEGGARQAARVFVLAPSESAAATRAERAIRLAMMDFGLADAPIAVRVTCTPLPRECLTRHGFVTVTVTSDVPLPLLPDALFGRGKAGIPVSSAATQQVSRFWTAGE